MPGTTAGVYTGGLTAGTEVSSTYEGRHITVLESELLHPKHSDGLVNKGDPVVLCDAAQPDTFGYAVGVAFTSASANTDYIAIDTEGIWNLPVYGEDDDGDRAIEIGDPLYIRAGNMPGVPDLDGTGDCEISKITNAVNQIPFGYALGSLEANGTGVIAIKVHWDNNETGRTAVKGFNHVVGTETNPLEWGTDTSSPKSVYMTLGAPGDYYAYDSYRAATTEDTIGGGIMGMFYGRITVGHSIQDMYGGRFRVDLVPSDPANEAANMVVGCMGSVSLNNPGYAYTVADSLKGGDFGASQTATSVLTTGSIRAIHADISNCKKNNAGRTQGVFVNCGGGDLSYPDYGVYVNTESKNCLAAVMCNCLAVNAGFGINFEDSGGFYYTALLRYDGVNDNGYFLQITAAAGTIDTEIILDGGGGTQAENADYRLRVRLVGNTTDRYIYLYPI